MLITGKDLFSEIDEIVLKLLIQPMKRLQGLRGLLQIGLFVQLRGDPL
jgi:hypothetical protein